MVGFFVISGRIINHILWYLPVFPCTLAHFTGININSPSLIKKTSTLTPITRKPKPVVGIGVSWYWSAFCSLLFLFHQVPHIVIGELNGTHSQGFAHMGRLPFSKSLGTEITASQSAELFLKRSSVLIASLTDVCTLPIECGQVHAQEHKSAFYEATLSPVATRSMHAKRGSK